MKQEENPTTQEMGASVEDALSVVKSKEEIQKEYRQNIVDMVCDVVASCDKGLGRICDAFKKDNPDFPDESTVRSWLRTDDELATQYARAKEEQVEKLVEQIIDISDDDSLDVAFKEDGTPFVDQQHIQRSKLRVDSRKWIASKLKPKKYGDKVEQQITGSLTVEVVKFGKDQTAE